MIYFLHSWKVPWFCSNFPGGLPKVTFTTQASVTLIFILITLIFILAAWLSDWPRILPSLCWKFDGYTSQAMFFRQHCQFWAFATPVTVSANIMSLHMHRFHVNMKNWTCRLSIVLLWLYSNVSTNPTLQIISLHPAWSISSSYISRVTMVCNLALFVSYTPVAVLSKPDGK